MVTPSGMVLDGALDKVEKPTAADRTTIRTATACAADPDLDRRLHEFYLLNYPPTPQQTISAGSAAPPSR
jgi:hypothetical protein